MCKYSPRVEHHHPSAPLQFFHGSCKVQILYRKVQLLFLFLTVLPPASSQFFSFCCPSLPAAAASACSCFSHSSGVKHFGVQAWIAAISVFKAAFTSRWRARLVFFAKTGETILAWKDDPQPPAFARREQHIISPENVD